MKLGPVTKVDKRKKKSKKKKKITMSNPEAGFRTQM